jgi:hypothetical protein
MQTNRTSIFIENRSPNQPSVDYGRLLHRLKNIDSLDIEDFRKEAFYTKTDLSNAGDPSLERITEDSLIPIPGMLIEYENSESGDSVPMSNWVAPHGPQWGPSQR